MKISKEEVEKIAHLARLNFKEAELDKIQSDLEGILGWMDKLNELDTTNVDPQIFMTEEMNVMREDEIKTTLSHDESLENAPQKDSNYFRVPKTLGE